MSQFAAERRPGRFLIDVGELLTVRVTHDEAVWRDLGGPGRREAAGTHPTRHVWGKGKAAGRYGPTASLCYR